MAMTNKIRPQNLFAAWLCLAALLGSNAGLSAGEGPWIHPSAQRLPTDKQGPFVHLEDGGILTIDATSSYVSRDGGKTWSEPRPLFPDGRDIRVRGERALLRTESGVIIAAFTNNAERNWTWSNKLHDAPGATLPTYVMRSLDGGKTWRDIQKLHADWTGAVRDIIETSDGRVIFTTMKLLHNPGRHAVMTYSSTDDGKTWTASNLIDLGGSGHHGGVMEPTLVELEDGRIWMLIRTNWGEFWSAYSLDGGQSWRVIKPSGIAASTAPAQLERLASGRLVLVWNRPYPEGTDEWPLSGGDGNYTATPVSNHRVELSIAFSDDEGASWTEPVVIARAREATARGGRHRVSYPYIFEKSPGTLWITTMQGGLRMSLQEEDFVEAEK